MGKAVLPWGKPQWTLARLERRVGKLLAKNDVPDQYKNLLITVIVSRARRTDHRMAQIFQKGFFRKRGLGRRAAAIPRYTTGRVLDKSERLLAEAQVEALFKKPMKSGQLFKDLSEKCGFKSPEEFYPLFRRIFFFKKTAKWGKSRQGQINALAGELFEYLVRNHPAFKKLQQEAEEIAKAYKLHHPNSNFGPPVLITGKIKDNEGGLLTDGLIVAFDDKHNVLILAIIEMKKLKVAVKLAAQLEKDIKRLLALGIHLPIGGKIMPNQIRLPLPVGGVSVSGQVRLASFAEGSFGKAKVEDLQKLKGLNATYEEIDMEALREFSGALLDISDNVRNVSKNLPPVSTIQP